MDLFDEDEGELVPLECTVVDSDERDPLALMREVRQELMVESMDVLANTMKFSEVDPDQEEPPDEWVQQLGLVRAKRALTIAKSAYKSSKDAPIALRLAADVFLGLTKAEALEKSGSKQLNVQVVQVATKSVDYPAMEVGGNVRILKK